MTQIQTLPLDQIDDSALPRDRTALDAPALRELQLSILTHGLRTPLEVYAKSDPSGTPPYGLISGLRRLTALRKLGQTEAQAILRKPQDGAEALALMVSENEIRADLTPWERGRIAVTALEAEVFDTLDAAINTLYAPLDRNRRARLRAVAEVVMDLGDDAFADPRALKQYQLSRLAFALRQGFGDLILATLAEAPNAAPDAQWKRLVPVLAEAEAEAKSPDTGPKYRPGRPRRMVHPRRALRIRRERTAEGWALRFTGPEATGPLMEDIMDYVEQNFGQS